ncbi:probable serine/threonine-protein kinase at1g01540 [Phtheirospermum japonicum]|uniref:non-specific serine/threonine protein kinase n=1 Tax=Phtheirospermum japonicum TaxID=374723 RepID=A0A830BRY6_9LAMI|nr:probable serine/threonine-protein kinase at1g01540 [Phtheirospermum japonicum]
MSDGKPAFLNDGLSKRTSIFGLRLGVVLGICVGAAIVIFLFLISLWFTSRRNNKKGSTLLLTHKNSTTIPNVSREIRVDTARKSDANPKLPPHTTGPDPEPDPVEDQRIHVEIGKGHRVSYQEKVGAGSGSGHGSGEARPSGEAGAGPEVSHLGWGHWYTLRELEDSTNEFADENVIGEGGYGIVYRGVLKDNHIVAVKNLLNNRGQAEREFKVEVEAIGRVRHKNLVRLLGYCAEGTHRMLVYEYVNNGNLEQWLHGDVGPYSPLTWDHRMNIILGTAKGYVAPEYASTGMLNERSDVYSFGILIMEIITGRNPVDYSRPPGEVNLVDWLKTMVSSRNSEGVLDPKLPGKPSTRALKRTLLVALRCVDPNAQKRPKMGHVVHMLEADDFPFRDDRRGGKEHGRTQRDGMKDRVILEKRVSEPGDSSGYESGVQTDMPMFRKQETDEER